MNCGVELDALNTAQAIVAELPQGSFAQLSLGEGVDSENLTAGYDDGVLYMTIPASPKTQSRRLRSPVRPGDSRVVPGTIVEQGETPADSLSASAG